MPCLDAITHKAACLMPWTCRWTNWVLTRPSTYLRRCLTKSGQERYAFDRFRAADRVAGFIPDMITLLIDGTLAKDAGAVQDTHSLLRKSIRKLLKAAGYQVPGRRHGLSSQARKLVERYVDHDRKADIDWPNP